MGEERGEGPCCEGEDPCYGGMETEVAWAVWSDEPICGGAMGEESGGDGGEPHDDEGFGEAEARDADGEGDCEDGVPPHGGECGGGGVEGRRRSWGRGWRRGGLAEEGWEHDGDDHGGGDGHGEEERAGAAEEALEGDDHETGEEERGAAEEEDGAGEIGDVERAGAVGVGAG